MLVLVLNAGSSSLKCQLVQTDTGEVLFKNLVERVGEVIPNHRAALEHVLTRLPGVQVQAVGHRVVHGGERFRTATLLTPEAITALEDLSPLAPLHNPPALACIHAAIELRPGLPNVAVFDTAFHATLPPHAYLYAIPYPLYTESGIRRYGFHGTSHAYVAREAARLLHRDLTDLKLVTLHLGNGASACAILNGQSVDTSMGFTPLEGLVMGTRSGDVDPGVVLWLAEREGADGANRILNRESGLRGLGGHSDLRDLHRAADSGDERAALALDVTAYRIRKQVGAYAAALGGLDAIVFTGGAGENDRVLRAAVVNGLGSLGLTLDAPANDANGPLITAPDSRAHALVVPTDEEGEIARQTAEILS